MSKLELILLGRFECLLSSGTRVSLSMRKAEIVLAFLALTPGLRHPRERLINLLWSDRSDEQARNSLRQCLSTIRKSLGEAAELALQIDRTTVCLNAELVEVDVHEFERLAENGDYESLLTATDLYQGEFLEGISVRDATGQEWLDSERARFKRQFVEILYNLAETQLVSHDYGHAIKSAERLVEQDPLAESGWRLLMQSHAANGNRNHALQAYKRCQQTLQQELEVEPEAATIELRDQIAGGKIGSPRQKTVKHADPAASTAPRRGTDEMHTIVVLPFDNLSGDPDQEYFSDGITESVIMNLALFPDLEVKSRNSSFALKRQLKDLGEISRELQVDYIVEGSVRKTSKRIRITVQLIDTGSGSQIWGNRYEADIADLFELEENLSRSIAATVTGKIESELQRIAVTKGAAGLQSYDLLLAGIYHMYRFTRQDNAIAIEKLQQCLAQDPNNVRAHAFLGASHVMDYLDRWTADYRASFETAGTHYHRALELDPELAPVQAFYAEYLNFSKNFEEAEKYLDKALARNPNDPDAITTLAICKRARGDHETALELAEKACQLDPYHPWAEWRLMSSQYLCGNYEAALATLKRLRVSPDFTNLIGIATLVKLGKLDEARRALQSFLQSCRDTMLSMPQSVPEWRQYASENFPFPDSSLSDDLVDCMLKAGLEDSTGAGAKPAGDTSHTIAVLPFDNLSGDPEQEYFSDGITESIIFNLALFPGLHVKSRHSSFAFKQQLKGLAEISRELEVDYLVEGSLRKAKDRIRITIQLIDAASGDQVWGKRYDAELTDLFDMEEELSRNIAATVTGRIESDLQRVAVTKGAVEQQAYDLLLQGIYHCHLFTPQDTLVSIEKLGQCLDRDPDNVRAHKHLYSSHLMNYLERWTKDYRASFERAAEHIKRALALAPHSDTVQIFYAQYLVFRGEFDQAGKYLDKALKTNPNNPDALTTLALKLEIEGQGEAALEAAERSCRLDPYHPWAEWEIAVSLFVAGRYEAVTRAISTMRTSPGFIRIFGIASSVRLDEVDAARRDLEIFLDECRASMLAMPQSRDDWLLYTRENYPFADARINEAIVDDLMRAGLEDTLKPQLVGGQSGRLPTVLVLPFANRSGDPEQEYFSDGITESVILNLSSFREIRVKSRHASFAFRESNRDIADIADELGVDYVVEGSIRKSADKIRITAQLTGTADGNQLWGRRFDAELENLLDLERELSQTIAGTVSGRIEMNTRRSALQKHSGDLRAYDYFMRGRYHIEHFTAQDIGAAIEQLEKCLALDPDYAPAHALLGMAHMLQRYDNICTDREQSLARARHHLERALDLDPEDATIRAYMAEYLMNRKDFDLALVYSRKSVELNPTLADGYSMLAWHAGSTRRYAEALEYADQSLRIDQFHPYAGWNAGEVYRASGDYQRAIDTFRSMAHLSASVRAQIAACYAGLGRLDEARAEMRQFLDLARRQMSSMPSSRDKWYRFWDETMPYQYPEDTDKFFDLLTQAGLCDELHEIGGDPPSIAVLPFANLSGDPEQEYFSDGITTGIILSLALFDGIVVKSQQTSFAFKASDLSSREIAAKVGAEFLVEGSIRKSAKHVRLSVQLIDAKSGTQIWGQQYNEELQDILDLEQKLSQALAATISGRLGHRIQQSAARKPATNLKSYDHLMRGLYHFGKFTREDMAIARKEIEKCLATDPDNVQAHANLAEAHVLDLIENWTEDRQLAEQKAFHHFETALELDPESSLAHAYYADFLDFQGQHDRAWFHADRAVEINPNSSEGHAVRTHLLSCDRRHEEAIRSADICLQLDPYSVGSNWAAGVAYRSAGRYQEAIKIFRRIPHPPPSINAYIAGCFVGMGLVEEGRAEMQRFLQIARRQAQSLPTNIGDWSEYWKSRTALRDTETFDRFFNQLVEAGLCDDDETEAAEIPSIAVLPFENMSGDPEQGHFADGITTDIIATLSKFRHLRTVSRYSTIQYKDHKVSIADIAAQQGVRYVLEGSVRKSGQRIRVSAELVDSEDGQILWNDRYDRDLDDLFAVQDEITRNIALAMKVQFDDGEMARMRSAGTSDIRVWEMALIATELQDTYIYSYIMESRKMAQEAIRLDPSYAFAWVLLAWTHFQETFAGWCESFEESIAAADEANRKALEIDPNYGEAWSQASTIALMKHEPDGALKACLKAVELEPGNAEIQILMTLALQFSGDYDEARKHYREVTRLCPVKPNWYYLPAGHIEMISGNARKAIEIYRQGVDAEPESPLCRFFLVDALYRQGDEAGARAYADEIRELDASVRGRGLVRGYSADEKLRQRLRDSLEKFDLY